MVKYTLMENTDLCPCSSGKTFGSCCGPIIAGEAKADTACALMRARYTSYVTGDVEFLKASAVKAAQASFDLDASRAWSQASTWHGLEIIRTEGGGADDATGFVEFRALYTTNGRFCNHHERASFVREDGDWKFADGAFVAETPQTREAPKISRNDPCPCGSGKKFKKCCGQ